MHHKDVCAAINVSALNDTSVTDMAVNKVYGAIPGSSVTFGCANGSVVIVKTIYCLSQGQWSAKPPFCSRGWGGVCVGVEVGWENAYVY